MAENNMDLLAWLRKHLAEAEPDLLHEMMRTFAEILTGTEAPMPSAAPTSVNDVASA